MSLNSKKFFNSLTLPGISRMANLPFIDSADLAYFQQGRTYGEADFEFDCGRISHGLLQRYNNLVSRE